MSLMQKAWTEIPVAQLLPVGTWGLRCKSASFKPAKEEGKSDTILVVYEAFEPSEDVSPDALEALGSNYDYTMLPIFHRIWIKSEADLDKFRGFLLKHGINCDDYATPMDAMKALKGTTVLGYLQQSTFKDKTENTVASFTAAD